MPCVAILLFLCVDLMLALGNIMQLCSNCLLCVCCIFIDK